MARRRVTRKRHKDSETRLWRGRWAFGTAALAVAIVAVVIAVGLASQGRDGDEAVFDADGTAAQGGHICGSGQVPADGRQCGADSALVKIIEFSDYQCPWCKRFVDATELELERQYIDKGLVQLEFHNFAILGGDAPPEQNESTLAAEAAECANDQGRYWEYHYKLFAEQRGENQGAFRPERLKQFASDLALDREDFDRCLDSHEHSDLILEQQRAALEAGVRGTPSFLVNGELAEGFRTFEQFAALIEAALESTEGS